MTPGKNGIKYLFAFEGGGSTARVQIWDTKADSVVFQGTLKQAANINTDRDSTLDAISTFRSQVAKHLYIEEQAFMDMTQATLCLPGTSNPDNVAWLQEQLAWPNHVITSDAMAGFYGVHEDPVEGDGILIGGTGEVGIGFKDNHFIVVAGTLGEDEICNGFWLGSHVVRNYKDMFNGAANGYSPDRLDEDRRRTASYATHVFYLAAQDNDMARKMLQESARNGAFFVQALAAHGIENFALVGSVAQKLQRKINTFLQYPVSENVEGAGIKGALRIAQILHEEPGYLDTINTLHRVEPPEIWVPNPDFKLA